MAGKKLDIVKKGADLGDDSWNATRGVFSKETVENGGPFIVGTIMFLIHGLEFRKASKKLFEALTNPNIRQRKVKITTSALGFLFTGAGIGLGVTYVAGHLSQLGMIGAVSTGTTALMPFLPVSLPGLLAATYLTYLARKIYIFSKAKKAEKKAWEDYTANDKGIDKNRPLAEQAFQEFKNQYYDTYQRAYEERIKQEKKVAFSIIEVLGSGFVVGGLIAGSVAIIGAASVATLGILPITLIAIGAGVGLISKAIEYFDDHAGPIKKVHDFYRKSCGLEPTPDITPGRFTQPARRAFRGLFKFLGMSSGELKSAELKSRELVRLPAPEAKEQHRDPAASNSSTAQHILPGLKLADLSSNNLAAPSSPVKVKHVPLLPITPTSKVKGKVKEQAGINYPSKRL